MQNELFGYTEYRDRVEWVARTAPYVKEELFNEFPVGIELEIESGGSSWANAKKIANAIGADLSQGWDLVIARDSSLDRGIEIISQPANLGYHFNIDNLGYNWEAGLRKATELGYTGEDNHGAGLHYNLSRKSVESCNNTNWNAIILTMNNRDWLRKFSRRIYGDERNVEDAYFGYCHFNEGDKFQYADFDDFDTVARRLQQLESWHKSHYRACALNKDAVIEFRFMASTLHYPYFKANLQLIMMLAWCIKHMDMRQISCIRFGWFWQFAKTNGFTEFINLCEQRRININPTIFPV